MFSEDFLLAITLTKIPFSIQVLILGFKSVIIRDCFSIQVILTGFQPTLICIIVIHPHWGMSFYSLKKHCQLNSDFDTAKAIGNYR